MPEFRPKRPTFREEVDAALDQVQRQREGVMRQCPCARRSQALAELCHIEADWWALLAERAPTRLQWRAALGARENALRLARRWRYHASTSAGPSPVPSTHRTAVAHLSIIGRQEQTPNRGLVGITVEPAGACGVAETLLGQEQPCAASAGRAKDSLQSASAPRQ
jgi:hypothetical protein